MLIHTCITPSSMSALIIYSVISIGVKTIACSIQQKVMTHLFHPSYLFISFLIHHLSIISALKRKRLKQLSEEEGKRRKLGEETDSDNETKLETGSEGDSQRDSGSEERRSGMYFIEEE